MNIPQQKPAFPWPYAAGFCALMVLLACGLTMVLGTGGVLLFSRLARQQEHQVAPVENFAASEASLESAKGWVEIQGEDGVWVQAQPGREVSGGERIRTGALSSATLAFFDGSRVQLKAGTELSIDELSGGNQERTIRLTQWAGESRHEVSENDSTGSRYEVRAASATGEALGTVFEVILTPEHEAYYYVIEGIVAVRSQLETVRVEAGKRTLILLDQAPMEPVASISGSGVVTQTGETWLIGGEVIHLTESTTILGDPQAGDWVSFLGHLGEGGSKVADWIVLLSRAPANRFSLTGPVSNIAETEWVINGQFVDVNEDTEIQAGIVVGDTVRVEGQILASGDFEALTIEKNDLDSGLPFDFSGVVNETGPEEWVVSGITLFVDENTVITDGLLPGEVVRVKGVMLEDGNWLAQKIIRQEDTTNHFTITGMLEQMDPWLVAGIGFETREWTVIPTGLKEGDLVRVEGQIDAEGNWLADRIERLDSDAPPTMVLIGTVLSIDPWVVSGIPLTIGEGTVIDESIKVGMLVRVEVQLLADGSWQVVRIDPISVTGWFPGCLEVIARVVSVSDGQVQLENWPAVVIDEQAMVEGGTLVPGSTVRLRICFDEDMVLHIVYIIILDVDIDEDEVNIPEEGGKVTVCHKPGKKKGGHTLTISRAALPAHLGHGDYEGPCR